MDCATVGLVTCRLNPLAVGGFVWDKSHMAHIRKHERSPFWYIRKRTFEGKWVEETTGLRIDSKEETHKARRLAEKVSMTENQTGSDKGSDFRSWLPNYFASRYKLKSPGTSRRVEIMWRTLFLFLRERGLFFPRQLKYRHAEDYMNWRQATPVNGRKVGHNTARAELKFLSQVMSEAVRRDYADSNPFREMEIALAPQKKKKALTDDQILYLQEEVKKEAPWMSIVLDIMLYTGCRFGESSIPISLIDFTRNELTLVDSKRNENDERKYFTVPIHPDLRPLLEKLSASGTERTVELSREKNYRFNRFLKRHLNASSHCLRVTFITKCHQSGMSDRSARRLVNHSSSAVHNIYSRLNAQDVRQAQSQISFPKAAKPLYAEPASPEPISRTFYGHKMGIQDPSGG